MARNGELIWLLGRLVPDQRTCARFEKLCRRIGVLTGETLFIVDKKFKAENNHEGNFTTNKIASCLAHLDADVARYTVLMVQTDRQKKGRRCL